MTGGGEEFHPTAADLKQPMSSRTSAIVMSDCGGGVSINRFQDAYADRLFNHHHNTNATSGQHHRRIINEDPASNQFSGSHAVSITVDVSEPASEPMPKPNGDEN